VVQKLVAMASWVVALAGGALIGGASALLLVTHGRIAGVSGVVGSLLGRASDAGWRVAFVAGLLVTGVFATMFVPEAIGAAIRPMPVLLVAGVLVGFGTRLGGGCTSGHGVCGLGRLSARSLIAVSAFITTGAATAWLARVVS
jgi:uncharacterized membrane protein YedE/YeeE